MSMPLEDIKVGMSVSYSQTITDYDVKAFAGISGDHNPVHVDDDYAATSRYKRRIAHGLISGSFFSALFGTKLPGPGCVYASQSFNFKRAIYLGDTVSAIATVTNVDVKNKKVYFDTICKVKNKIVIDGQAVLFIPGKK
ncbi:MaoC family dehydratase [Photobacterium damselae]|uniref:MaoC family dehydratase n=1 Tax=Photobacterium damselae TaxID=38293 RepID=UPI000D9E2BAF|nr:MaoC family dehydratase [Photobacterium damselae]NVO72614.1 MaoC family dehydratase [Photobacterium damselae subsp. damselae]SPY22968.1 (R)-specific enoyl-CoA hydratase [Photobacterium damselae]